MVKLEKMKLGGKGGLPATMAMEMVVASCCQRVVVARILVEFEEQMNNMKNT